MEKSDILGSISTIVESVAVITKGNPENKDFRLKKRKKKELRKHLDKAEDYLENLQEWLTNDSDGFTEKDKAMIKQAEDAIAQQRLALIKMVVY